MILPVDLSLRNLEATAISSTDVLLSFEHRYTEAT
jgi:hypothetical protein